MTLRRRRLSVPVSIGFGAFALLGLSGVAAGKGIGDRIFAAALLLAGAALSTPAWRMATVTVSDGAVSVRSMWTTRRFTRSGLRNFQVLPKAGGLGRAGFALAAVFADGSTLVLPEWWSSRAEGQGTMGATSAVLNRWLSSESSA